MVEDTSASHSAHCLVLKQYPKHLCLPGVYSTYLYRNISQPPSYCHEGGSILHVVLLPCEDQPWKNRILKEKKGPRRSQCPVSHRCQKYALQKEQVDRGPSLGIFPCLQKFPAQCCLEPEVLSLHLTVIVFLLHEYFLSLLQLM